MYDLENEIEKGTVALSEGISDLHWDDFLFFFISFIRLSYLLLLN